MNRQMKRMQERQERQAKRTGLDRQAAPSATARRAAAQERAGRRTPVREFLKQVRAELKRVAWPTRRELISYTVVVLVTVTVLTALVFGLDFGFSKAIFNAITNN
jgi:preprotein translocase subunit SecE